MDDKNIIQDKRWKRLFWKVVIIPHKIVMFFIITFTILIFSSAFIFIMYKFENPLEGDFINYVLTINSKIKFSGIEKEKKDERFEVRFARLSFFSGQVSVRKEGRLRWDAAVKDLSLGTRDIIRTYSNSYAEVYFDDGNILQIKPDSLVVIGNLTEDAWTKEKHSSVKLMESDIEADIKKPEVIGSKFNIETPNAVASIKDEAKIAIKVTNEQASQIKVFTGSVDVQVSDENVKVKPAEAIEISSNKEIVKIKDLPEGPVLNTPENQKEFFYKGIEDSVIILKWEGDSKSVKYHLEIAKDIHFVDLLISKDDLSERSVYLQEMPQGAYYWRVRGINRDGYKGASSDLRAFKIVFDNTPPRILIDNILILSDEKNGILLYLTGETEPNTELTINEKKLKADAAGRFRSFLKAKGDKEVLKIEAFDVVGNRSYLEKIVSVK